MMKDLKPALYLLAAVVLLATATLGLDRLRARTRTVDAAAKQPPVIQVVGETRVATAPDMASFDVAVVAKDPSPQAAADKLAGKMEKVIAGLRGQGVARGQMKTSELSLSDYTDYATSTGGGGVPRRIPKGFQATHRLDVKLDKGQLGRIGAILNAAITAGANQIGTVAYGVRDEAGLRSRGLEAAVRSARQKAEAIAREAGVSIIGVSRIGEGEGDPVALYDQPVMRLSFAKAAGEPVAPTEVSRQVVISAQFLVSK